MDEKKVSVLARIRAKEGMMEELSGALLALVRPTRSEKGCINYDLHRATEDEALFVFYENWQSKEDLDKHLRSEHMRAFLSKADDLLAEPIEVTLMEKMG